MPAELVRAAEAAASRFLARPQGEEEEAPTLGYGSKRVGNIGCVEYLLLASHTSALCPSSPCPRQHSCAPKLPSTLRQRQPLQGKGRRTSFTRDNGNNHRLQ